MRSARCRHPCLRVCLLLLVLLAELPPAAPVQAQPSLRACAFAPQPASEAELSPAAKLCHRPVCAAPGAAPRPGGPPGVAHPAVFAFGAQQPCPADGQSAAQWRLSPSHAEMDNHPARTGAGFWGHLSGGRYHLVLCLERGLRDVAGATGQRPG